MTTNTKLRQKGDGDYQPLSDLRRKKRVSMTISHSTLHQVDQARGDMSRSAYIESMVLSNLERTVGALHLDDIQKKNGVVYTPTLLAEYVANKVVNYFFETVAISDQHHYKDSSGVSPRELRIIDPACGSGELLTAVWGAFNNGLKTTNIDQQNSSCPDPRQVLCGVDIDDRAVHHTKRRISRLQHSSREKIKTKALNTNALYPFGGRSSQSGWKRIKKLFDAPSGFDIVIANPPWGADIESYRDHFSSGEFSLFRGQFDTSDLFVELALRILKPGGLFAFIIPDSLFNEERIPLRKLLLERAEIKFVARLGEKIFENVNRACAVLICKKTMATKLTLTDCLRLTPELRSGILQGDVTFEEAELRLGHKVAQNRFLKNPDYRLDIDVRANEEGLIGILRNGKGQLKDYLLNSRGVELSKSGKVCQCSNCDLWMPFPSGTHMRCRHCGARLSSSATEAESIVSSIQMAEFKELLVGENIKRYNIDSNYWIALGKKGINYKDKTLYAGNKIVVRKTGVGLTAAIDYHDYITNQVVYIFKLRVNSAVHLPLELFLAIMNSRIIYYYLVKSHGETEWRSHPYLTQKQILDLPMPSADLTKKRHSATIQRIKTLIYSHTKKGSVIPHRVDAEIEHLVAGLYGLRRSHYERIYETLGDVEELLPIKALKRVTISDIFTDNHSRRFHG